MKQRGRPLRGDQRRERVSFTIHPGRAQWLNAAAHNLGISRSELFDQLIYLAQGEIGPETILALGKSGINVPRAVVDRFCRFNKIEKLMLFGSALTDSFNDDSDIDLLVSFDPGCKPSLIQQSAMERELSDILGRKVELRTSGDLSRYFRKEVLNNAQGLFPDGH